MLIESFWIWPTPAASPPFAWVEEKFVKAISGYWSLLRYPDAIWEAFGAGTILALFHVELDFPVIKYSRPWFVPMSRSIWPSIFASKLVRHNPSLFGKAIFWCLNVSEENDGEIL